jgi:hypothetical protein
MLEKMKNTKTNDEFFVDGAVDASTRHKRPALAGLSYLTRRSDLTLGVALAPVVVFAASGKGGLKPTLMPTSLATRRVAQSRNLKHR